MFVDTKKDGEVTTALEPWRKLLLDAAALIERVGLAKRTMLDCTGAVCTRGALILSRKPDLKAIPDWAWDRDAVAIKADYELGRYVSDRAGVHVVHPVVAWNNHPDRKQQDVVATMRACARQGL